MNATAHDTTPELHTYPASELSRLFRHAIKSASKDSARVNLNCVQFTQGGEVVSTDGHRLHIITTDVTIDQTTLVKASALEACAKIMKGGGYVSVAFEGARFVFEGDGIRLEYRASDFISFPPYKQLVDGIAPAETTITAVVGDLRKALKACDDEKVTLVSVPDGFEVIEGVEPSKGRTSCSLQYLSDAIRCAEVPNGGEVTISWSGPLEPIVVRSGSFFAMVMPVRS